MEDMNFWLTMPVMEGAFELIAAGFANMPTELLTALPSRVPRRFHKQIREAKIEWAERALHIPRRFVNVVYRREKRLYACTVGRNKLVDDAEQNCAEWVRAGGSAFLFKGDFAAAVDWIKKP